jgi:hypothetical protein
MIIAAELQGLPWAASPQFERLRLYSVVELVALTRVIELHSTKLFVACSDC